MTLLSRYMRSQATVRSQRRQLHRLHQEAAKRDADVARLRTILSGHPEVLRRLLAASPDQSKRMAFKFHDRALELTHANASMKCSACGGGAGVITINKPDERKSA